jgi:hypothetical protein
LDAVSDEVQSAGPVSRETTGNGDSPSKVPDDIASATFTFGPLMWLLRALRDGSAVLDDEEMVACVDARMIEAKDFCPQWTEIHDYWRDTLEAHAAAKAAVKVKTKPRKLRRVA